MKKTAKDTAAVASLPLPENLTFSALIAHGYLPLQAGLGQAPQSTTRASRAELGTVLGNLAYYGFAPSVQALQTLRGMTSGELAMFWRALHASFKALTGADRQMDRFVVYKNFPQEVLEMSAAQCWVAQIFMYLGAPNEWFTQEELVRAPLNENIKLKVLQAADEACVSKVAIDLVTNKARWTDAQRSYAVHLARQQSTLRLELSRFGFKENGIHLMAKTMDVAGEFVIEDATDVLRLAAALSGAEPSLREAFKFRSFKRAERRMLLALLDESRHLMADISLRPDLWKRLLAKLHPGDFKFAKVQAAYDSLYKGDFTTFNGDVEKGLAQADASVLTLLASRPGEFARRLHKAYAVFGMDAARAFAQVADKLETSGLLKLRGYLSTINGRAQLVYPPKGNWGKLRVEQNEKKAFSHQALTVLRGAIDEVLAARLGQKFPQGVMLAEETADIKLQTNDQELAPYGRGTVFPIPQNVSFIRTASYWAQQGYGNTWFDNGVCFYGEGWNPMGTCCWNSTHEMGGAAVFSGDPTNSKDLKGRACQMIDLYLDKLQARGVRYAVWNVLAYNHIPFSQAEDVLATLQWGEHAEKGRLYEPSRAQMVFPLKGDNMVKYVAYIDVVERKLVYMDANFSGQVSSAKSNEYELAKKMPAFVEYLQSLPSVADLFMNAPEGEVPVLYSDLGHELKAGQTAYVFRPQNAQNAFTRLELSEALSA